MTKHMIIEPLQFISDVRLPAALGSEEDSLNFEDVERKRIVARACRDGAWCWLWLENIGSFRFPRDPTEGRLECEVVLEEGACRAKAVDEYYRSVVPLALQVYGFEALHGTAVRGRAGAVVLLAPSKTGKTTLACEVVARGYELAADDAVVIDVSRGSGTGSVALRPLPFVPRLRGDSAARYGVPVRDKTVVSGTISIGAPVPVAAFVMLDRGPHNDTASLRRLGPSEALKALLSRCYFHHTDDSERQREMVAAYLNAARATPVYRLSYADGYERLGAATDLIQRLCLGEADVATAA